MPYAEAFELQQSLQQVVIQDRGGGGRQILLLVEHDPVITVTRRPGARDHVLADTAALARAGVDLVETNRGGDVTWHGPGQLVVYPILDLNRLGLRLHEYMRWLESCVLDVLSTFNLQGVRDDTATGVWIEGQPSRKIAALGVRVSRWVSMHGLALNVDPDLSHYDFIVPCGLHGRSVTSLARELGSAPPMGHVKALLVDAITSRVEAAMCEVESRTNE
jgi:lipoate-protein ligase B